MASLKYFCELFIVGNNTLTNKQLTTLMQYFRKHNKLICLTIKSNIITKYRTTFEAREGMKYRKLPLGADYFAIGFSDLL